MEAQKVVERAEQIFEEMQKKSPMRFPKSIRFRRAKAAYIALIESMEKEKEERQWIQQK